MLALGCGQDKAKVNSIWLRPRRAGLLVQFKLEALKHTDCSLRTIVDLHSRMATPPEH